MPARILNPIIGNLIEYKIAQSELKSLYLNEQAFLTIDMERYVRKLVPYSYQTTNITATGIVYTTFSITATKYCTLKGVNLKQVGGTFTTTWAQAVVLLAGSSNEIAVGFSSDHSISVAPLHIPIQDNIRLVPGDQVTIRFNVDTWSVAGPVLFKVLLEEY